MTSAESLVKQNTKKATKKKLRCPQTQNKYFLSSVLNSLFKADTVLSPWLCVAVSVRGHNCVFHRAGRRVRWWHRVTKLVKFCADATQVNALHTGHVLPRTDTFYTNTFHRGSVAFTQHSFFPIRKKAKGWQKMSSGWKPVSAKDIVTPGCVTQRLAACQQSQRHSSLFQTTKHTICVAIISRASAPVRLYTCMNSRISYFDGSFLRIESPSATIWIA